MILTDNNYCVILAGGRGLRLWPSSRKEKPKQFVDFFGSGRTQLQNTYDRMARIVRPDHILVVSGQAYADMVREQLPELPTSNLLLEPLNRNTAPALAWAVQRIMRRHPEASIICTPSDQVIINEEAFTKCVQEGLQFVATQPTFIAMGVKPTRPEPGYGYIQMGQQIEKNVYQVKSFTEKPERDFARMFLESNEFYWNTGLFLGSAATFDACFRRHLPAVLADYFRTHGATMTAEEETAFIAENYPLYPNLSIDELILERSDNVCVMVGQFGWADLGTWHSIYEAMHKSEGDNVVVDSDVILEECHGNVIKLPKGRLAVINGLEGFIVAENDNVLLICKREDSSALIRKYVNEVQLRKGEDYL